MRDRLGKPCEGSKKRPTIRESLALYKERERQEMIQGYQEMAALNKELAEESMSAVNEVWARYD
ncbi:MAG: hypothetical protein E3J21_26320 [Anaerolineales bacterium]|nr:MAG: hypothetical protein E3J21_26320 [Anaerolineales bacterium]